MKPEATNPGKELELVEVGVPDCREVRERRRRTECVLYIICTYEIVNELT